ncbi:MAG TPA: peptidase S8, partial [Candidatus Bathyarchaeia archaeon]|nr:peptidase S8 [Candidatus Bathyarchaeia archaeon]
MVKKLLAMSNTGIFLICLLLFSMFPKSVDAFYDPDIPRPNSVVMQYNSGLIHFQPVSDQNPLQRYIVFGSGPLSDITSEAKNVIYGESSSHGSFAIGIFQQNEVASLKLKGYNVIEDMPLEFDSIPSKISHIHDAARVDEILGTDKVITKYHYTGAGIKIGIVDQGTDFSNPDMQDSVARGGRNIPIMIDADGQGLVLTNQTFIANINNYGVISNYTNHIPKGITSYVYVTSQGVFINLSNNGQGTTIQAFNSNYPKGGTPVINGTVSNDYKIGKDSRHYIVSKSGIYHF